MKTLNDTLIEEFETIKNSEQIMKIIKEKNLDEKIIDNAFQILLSKKKDTNYEKNKTEFENFIINKIKEDEN